jgi:hypothetical protein
MADCLVVCISDVGYFQARIFLIAALLIGVGCVAGSAFLMS